MKVIKRDGSVEQYDLNKIRRAIELAANAADPDQPLKEGYIDVCTRAVDSELEGTEIIDIEEIQNVVENILMAHWPIVGKDYILYRAKRAQQREAGMISQVNGLFDQSDEYLMKENANKKANLTNVQQSYLGGILSTHYCRTQIFPKDVLAAHDKGAIHIHDMDMSAMPGITNCCLVNLYDCLYNGTVMNDVGIDPQTKFVTACTVATQIVQGVAGLQYGGITVTMSHLVPALKTTWESIKNNAEKFISDKQLQAEYIISEYAKEIRNGIQTFMYQVNSMFTTQGQTPFLTVNLYINEVPEEDRTFLADIIEEVLNQRIKGFKDRYGNWVAPAFPKLIYVLCENNINPGTEYYYLTELAAECNAYRMVPDYISEKVMKEIHGHCFPSMGCRSFLSEYSGDPDKFYGRNNCGVVSLNLPYIAAEAVTEGKDFWDVLYSYADLAHKAHQTRLKRILNTSVDCAPLLWRDGVFARTTNPDAKIGDIVKDGYASVSLGYSGLYECIKILTGLNHWEGDGKQYAFDVMQALNDFCKAWTEEDHMKYGVYGTPMETGTYKFAKALKSIWPSYDRLYVTNSYHIPVFIDIDPFKKLELEGEFQKYSKNGCISYIECADLTKNPEAIHEVQKCIYEHCMYAELNIKSCKCYTCGSEEPMAIDDNLVWYCTKCGEKRPEKLRHLYRICGYASTNDSNAGRTSDVKDRIIHMDNKVLWESTKCDPETSQTDQE